MADLSIMCWGSNQSGELGTGGRFSAFTPIPVQL
jgi:hypothetical protein